MARAPLEIGEVGTVNTVQLPNGKWKASCRYKGEDGKLRLIERTRPSKTAAIRDCRKAATEAGQSGHGEITLSTPFSVVAESWWETITSRNLSGELADSTVANYQRTYVRVVAGVGGLTIREATPTRLSAWVKKEAGGYPSVHRDLKRTLSEMFTHAISLNATTFNAGKAITPMPSSRKATTALSVDEVLELREVIRQFEDDMALPKVKDGKRIGGRPRGHKYLADVVEVLLGTGLRIGEVLGLRWQDVDLASSPATVTVAGALKTRKASPRKPSLYWEAKAKSRSSLRTLSLPPFAVEVLLRLHVENDQGHEYVFSSSRGTPRFPANVRQDLRDACGATFEGLTPHTLRRTVATIVEAGMDVRAASMMLGHSEVSVTERAYVRRSRIAPDTSEVLGSVLGDSN